MAPKKPTGKTVSKTIEKKATPAKGAVHIEACKS
jgi:hypothetical protein